MTEASSGSHRDEQRRTLERSLTETVGSAREARWLLDDALSGGDYDRWMGRWSRLLAHEFLEWLNLPGGLRWIDICCGSGVLTEAIVGHAAPASEATRG